MQQFTIPGRLEGMNSLVNANRKNKYAGAELKKTSTALCTWYAWAGGMQRVERYPVTFLIEWVEQNGRRDPDNIASAKKYIFDGLIKAGVLENDGPKQIEMLIDTFRIDSRNPRIIVSIFESGEPIEVNGKIVSFKPKGE